jgi:phosphatidylglycerophosphate synthase
VPNTLTAVRIILALTIAWFLYQGSPGEIIIAGILLIIAGLTDGLDGYLARRLKQSTLGGSLFDLVADQVLVIPCLILAIAAGLFARTDHLMPFNPYPYAVLVLASGVAVLSGVGTFIWKRRSRMVEFPSPTITAKAAMCFWIPTLVVAILNIGPDVLLAILMYLAIISTVLAFYSYLRKGGYVFTD